MSSSTYNLGGLASEELLLNHLKIISFKYSTISPALSSYYMSRVQEFGYAREVLEKDTSTPICPYCGLIRNAENTLVRVLPKIRESKSLVKLRKKSKCRRKRLSHMQKNILQLADSQTNQMVNICSTCKKKVRTRMNVPVIPSNGKMQNTAQKINKKPKKKRVKDLNAGLIIPNSSSLRQQINHGKRGKELNAGLLIPNSSSLRQQINHAETPRLPISTPATKQILPLKPCTDRRNPRTKHWNDPFHIPVVNTLESFLTSVC